MSTELVFNFDNEKIPFLEAISELMALDIDRTLSEEKQVMVELLDNERRIAHHWVLREQLKGVRRNQYPYDPETKPHHHKLIEVSLWICDRQRSDSNIE